MNQLSTRLYSALASPTVRDIRKSSSAYASSASIRVPGPVGGEDTVGACLRQQYYRLTGEVPTDVGETDWSIASYLGEKVHEMILDLLQEHGFRMGLQVIKPEHAFVDPALNLSARCDFLVWDYAQNELVGIEVKSVGEYKAGKCIETPAQEHVMQSMLYLDFYQRHIPPGQFAPTKWYIWYISRTENWTIKGKKHGSPFSLMWDYYITLDGKEGTVSVHTANGSQRWEDFTVAGIHKRYLELDKAVAAGDIPERDFDLRYTETKIAGMHKLGLLQYKKDKEPVEKWLKKGAKPGELKLELGDFECRVCPWKSKCWAFPVNTYESREPFNLPAKQAPKQEADPVL